MTKYFILILALLAGLSILGCSDKFEPPIAPTNTKPAPPDTITWSVETDLQVNSNQLRQTESVAIGHAGEFHLWMLVKYDAREKYLLWVVFNYQDGTKKLFPVPDLYSDRPSTILFDVGEASIEDTLSVTLLIEKPSTSAASPTSATALCDGWDRLLKIYGSNFNAMPTTCVAFDKIIRLNP